MDVKQALRYIMFASLGLFLVLALSGCGILSPSNAKPEAAFQAESDEASGPLTVRFDGSSSSDTDGKIIDYEWTFGDGTTAEQKIVTHTFPSASTYNVSLKVTDDQGATDSVTKSITLTENEAPIARLDATPTSGKAPLEVTFELSRCSDPDGAVQSYSLQFDDGDSVSGSDLTKAITHTYHYSGTYEPVLTIYDDKHASDTAAVTISVSNDNSNQPPQATIETNKTSPLTVSFDGSKSSDPDGTITTYTWTFGDGNSATGKEVSHTYQKKGEYTAVLEVVDDNGDSDTTSVTIDANQLQPPPPP